MAKNKNDKNDKKQIMRRRKKKPELIWNRNEKKRFKYNNNPIDSLIAYSLFPCSLIPTFFYFLFAIYIFR